MINNIPSRNDILSLQTESYESLQNDYAYTLESDMYGGRDKPSPGDAYHQDAIEYLKNEMKLPEIEARAYKSIAYRKVKEMKPEANHLERAQLMLELVKSKNFIKENKDKLDEVVKILERIDMEKQAKQSDPETKSRRSKGSRAGSRKASRKVSRKASRKASRKTSRKTSRKGSRKAQNGGNINNYSETSVNNFTESNANVPYYKEYMAEKAKYLQAKQMQNGGIENNYSETSVNNFTESNVNIPYYNEYMAEKTKYLQAKQMQNGGNVNNYSETSVNNFTESNANVPYYKEYMAEKAKYLQAKQMHQGGAYVMNEWPGIKPNYPNAETPELDLVNYLARIEEFIIPNLIMKNKIPMMSNHLNGFANRINNIMGNRKLINC
jgi:hypothetical protein